MKLIAESINQSSFDRLQYLESKTSPLLEDTIIQQ
jgi:hypothetical protein